MIFYTSIKSKYVPSRSQVQSKSKPLSPYDKRGVREGRAWKLSVSVLRNGISRTGTELFHHSAEFHLLELLNKPKGKNDISKIEPINYDNKCQWLNFPF